MSHGSKGGLHMEDELRAALDELAQVIQVIAPLAVNLRRTLGDASLDVIAIETATDRAMQVFKRLRRSEEA